MAVPTTSSEDIDTLIRQGEWAEAGKLIEHELAEQPDNHWLLTQLGVIHYEQGQYRESLRPKTAKRATKQSAKPSAKPNSVFNTSSTARTMKFTTGSGVYHTPRAFRFAGLYCARKVS